MNPNLLRNISQEELGSYERDGVRWLPRIIDLDWVNLLAKTIEEILARQLGQFIDFTGLGLALGSAELAASGRWSDPARDCGTTKQLSGKVLLDEQVKPAGRRGHYISATDTWKLVPAMRELALRSPVPKIAAELMRSRRVYLCGEQVLVKPPGTLEKTAWHSDQGYGHIQGEQVCGVRIPTTQETERMGLVQYLRGSHKSGAVYKVNYFISDASDDDEGLPIPQIEGHEEDFDLVTFAAGPGDVVVHHIGTLHGAGGNATSDRTRAAVTIRYAGDRFEYKFRRFAPPQDALSQLLKDGDPLDGEPERFPRAEC